MFFQSCHGEFTVWLIFYRGDATERNRALARARGLQSDGICFLCCLPAPAWAILKDMPIRSGVLSFGLVAIPGESLSSHQRPVGALPLAPQEVRQPHPKPTLLPAHDNEVVQPEDLIRGFQVSKENYVQITEEELEALEAEANRSIDLKEFVPLDSVDPVFFDNPYYLAPDKGGEKPYRLLADALEKMKRIAIAELVSSGKEQLVLIRPYQNGLVMHTAYYAKEVRNFSEVPKGESADVGKEEIQLALGLIERLSSEEFDPDQYKDEYRLRVLAMVEEKAKGSKIESLQRPRLNMVA